MADDWIAGIYACLLMGALVWCFRLAGWGGFCLLWLAADI
jgi:hypothetical protein